MFLSKPGFGAFSSHGIADGQFVRSEMAHQPQDAQSAAEMSPEIENQIVERGEFRQPPCRSSERRPGQAGPEEC